MPSSSILFDPAQPEIADSSTVWSRQREIDIITCEYPPTVGGVADYTLKVVEKLEQAGFETRVWAPGGQRNNDSFSTNKIKRSFVGFGLRDLLAHDRLMGTAKDRRLLLQWEPVGFGLQSLNLPFCLWVFTRALRGTRLLVMFHETFLPFKKRSLKRFFAGAVQRLMAFTLVNTADAAFASNEIGALSLKRLCFRPAKVVHLPVFSNVENPSKDAKLVAALRERYVQSDEALVGHFGRFMANTEPLVLPAFRLFLERNPRVKVLFIGECAAKYRSTLLDTSPELGSRVFASGICTSDEVAELISVCDFMFQPYPGGLTTKRSSTMAALAQGRCVVSNRGEETERLWSDCRGVRLLETLEPAVMALELGRLTHSKTELKLRCAATSVFYHKHFSLEHTAKAFLSSIQNGEAAPRFVFQRTASPVRREYKS